MNTKDMLLMTLSFIPATAGAFAGPAYTVTEAHAIYQAMDVDPVVTDLGSNPRQCPDTEWTQPGFSQPLKDEVQVKTLPGLICEQKVSHAPIFDKLGRCQVMRSLTTTCAVSKHTAAADMADTYDKLFAPEDVFQKSGVQIGEKRLGTMVLQKRTYSAGHTFYEVFQVIPKGGFENSSAAQLYEALNVAEIPTYLGFEKALGPVVCSKRVATSATGGGQPTYKCEVDGAYISPLYFKTYWQG